MQASVGNRAVINVVQRGTVHLPAVQPPAVQPPEVQPPAVQPSAVLPPAVQRDRAQQDHIPGHPQYTKANRPKRGADVRAALRAQLPGLLAGLTEEQLNRWQGVVDYYAISRHIDHELRELAADYQSRYPGLAVGGQGQFQGYGPYNDAVNALNAARPQRPGGGDKFSVDPAVLMADDVRAEPQWDVKAEKAFRDWAIGRLAKDPPIFDMYPNDDDEIISRRTDLGTYTTKGVISLGDLRHQFAAEYAAQVTDRPDWQHLRTALSETISAYTNATEVHRERSKINKDNQGWFGVDIVRNIIEAVGEGDQDYPTMAQWIAPKALIDRAVPLLADRKFELAVPILAMAEMSTAQAADRIFAYDHRVETGAGIAVKWLGRIKTVGSVAAGIAAGPLGITGSALVAGGYTFVQEGAQNVSAIAHGQRTDLGLAGLVKQAGTATVLGLLGGALQARFQSAIAGRMAQWTGSAGGAVRDKAVSLAASMTSSVYTTAAETALAAVVDGKALPKDATELADLIVDKALEAGAMDVALHGPSARAAREYQEWRSGGAAAAAAGGAQHDSTGPTSGLSGTRPASDPNTQHANASDPQPNGLPDPAHLPEDVARRLLQDSGGWDRLAAELHEGTGLGHGLMPAERRALLDRFEASRELLARDVGGLFGGTVTSTDGGHGKLLEVRFVGDTAASQLAQAQAYLDTKHPGWARDSAVSLAAGPKAVAGGPKSLAAIKALERATPAARKVAAELAPLYEKWTGLKGQERLELLVEVVNRQLWASGAPEVHPAFGNRGAAEDGAMIPRTWELQIRADLLKGHTQTPEQFAYACGIAMHEGHHALQMFRAARTNPVLAQPRLDPAVFDAVMKVNRGDLPGESLKVSSLEYAEAADVRESLWGSGRTYNKEVYTRFDTADTAVTMALQNVLAVKGEPRNSHLRQVAVRNYIAAKAARDTVHDEYMRLPEEVEAWRIGKETEAAVKERLRLDAALVTARAAEKAAHDAFNALENPMLAALLDPGRTPSATAVQAFEQAMARHQQAIGVVGNIVARRHALATKGTP